MVTFQVCHETMPFKKISLILPPLCRNKKHWTHSLDSTIYRLWTVLWSCFSSLEFYGQFGKEEPKNNSFSWHINLYISLWFILSELTGKYNPLCKTHTANNIMKNEANIRWNCMNSCLSPLHLGLFIFFFFFFSKQLTWDIHTVFQPTIASF